MPRGMRRRREKLALLEKVLPAPLRSQGVRREGEAKGDEWRRREKLALLEKGNPGSAALAGSEEGEAEGAERRRREKLASLEKALEDTYPSECGFSWLKCGKRENFIAAPGIRERISAVPGIRILPPGRILWPRLGLRSSLRNLKCDRRGGERSPPHLESGSSR